MACLPSSSGVPLMTGKCQECGGADICYRNFFPFRAYSTTSKPIISFYYFPPPSGPLQWCATVKLFENAPGTGVESFSHTDFCCDKIIINPAFVYGVDESKTVYSNCFPGTLNSDAGAAFFDGLEIDMSIPPIFSLGQDFEYRHTCGCVFERGGTGNIPWRSAVSAPGLHGCRVGSAIRATGPFTNPFQGGTGIFGHKMVVWMWGRYRIDTFTKEGALLNTTYGQAPPFDLVNGVIAWPQSVYTPVVLEASLQTQKVLYSIL